MKTYAKEWNVESREQRPDEASDARNDQRERTPAEEGEYQRRISSEDEVVQSWVVQSFERPQMFFHNPRGIDEGVTSSYERRQKLVEQ